MAFSKYFLRILALESVELHWSRSFKNLTDFPNSNLADLSSTFVFNHSLQIEAV